MSVDASSPSAAAGRSEPITRAFVTELDEAFPGARVSAEALVEGIYEAIDGADMDTLFDLATMGRSFYSHREESLRVLVQSFARREPVGDEMIDCALDRLGRMACRQLIEVVRSDLERGELRSYADVLSRRIDAVRADVRDRPRAPLDAVDADLAATRGSAHQNPLATAAFNRIHALMSRQPDITTKPRGTITGR